MTRRKARLGWHGAAGLLVAALVTFVPAPPAAATGLFETLFGGMNRALNGAPPPASDPAYANPDGPIPANNPPRRWSTRASGTAARADEAASRTRWTPKGAPPAGDPTLRPGDVVATTKGLVVYTGGRGGLPNFVPVQSYPYFGRNERSHLLALKVTPPDHRWGAEAALAPSTTVSSWKPDAFAEFDQIRTARR